MCPAIFWHPWFWGAKLSYYPDTGSAERPSHSPFVSIQAVTQDGAFTPFVGILSVLPTDANQPNIVGFPSQGDRLTEAIYIMGFQSDVAQTKTSDEVSAV